MKMLLLVRLAEAASKKFNRWPLSRRKQLTGSVAIVAAAALVGIMVSSLRTREAGHSREGFEQLRTPTLELMNNNDQNKLTPIGKLKGDIDGNYEMMYLAVDEKGQLFINRDIEYGSNAYVRSERWRPITREELDDYERKLHFLPLHSRGKRP